MNTSRDSVIFAASQKKEKKSDISLRIEVRVFEEILWVRRDFVISVLFTPCREKIPELWSRVKGKGQG